MNQDYPWSTQEIKDRLHYFNLTRDWTAVMGASPKQEVCFMYPEVIRVFGDSDAQHKSRLLEQFGPLSPQWQTKYDEWLKTAQLRK